VVVAAFFFRLTFVDPEQIVEAGVLSASLLSPFFIAVLPECASVDDNFSEKVYTDGAFEDDTLVEVVFREDGPIEPEGFDKTCSVEPTEHVSSSESSLASCSESSGDSVNDSMVI